MDRIECEKHEKALYYCGTCIKLFCNECDPHGEHLMKQIDDVEPFEIKADIEKKNKALQELSLKFQKLENQFKDIKGHKLYFLEKKTGTEINPVLFEELGNTMADIRIRGGALNDMREKCDNLLTPHLETIKKENNGTGDLMAGFDELVKDSKKFGEIYRNRPAYQEHNEELVEANIKDLFLQYQEYHKSVEKIYSVLEKYWFDGIPQKLLSLKNLDREITTKTNYLIEAKVQQGIVVKSQDNLLKMLRDNNTEADKKVKSLTDLINTIKSKSIGEQVENLMKELAANNSMLIELSNKNASLTETKIRMEQAISNLKDMQDTLQRGIIEKNREHDSLKAEISAKQNALMQIEEGVKQANQKVENTLSHLREEIETSEKKLEKMVEDLQDIASDHEEWKSKLEEVKREIKEKEENLKKIKNKITAQKNIIKENHMTLEKYKLEIEDYIKNTQGEIEKNKSSTEELDKNIQTITNKKEVLTSWLKNWQKQTGIGLIILAGFRRDMQKAEKQKNDKEEEIKVVIDKWKVSVGKLNQIEDLIKKHESILNETSKKLEEINEEISTQDNVLVNKIKEFVENIEIAKQDFMRDKCGNCKKRAGDHGTILQCKHKLCKSCEDEILQNYKPTSFSLQCEICKKTSQSILSPLKCGCGIEVSQIEEFYQRIKEDTRNMFYYYNSFELTITPAKCQNGHTISDEELLSFYHEPINLYDCKANLKKLLEEDTNNPKRNDIINAIKGKTEAKIFNSKYKLGKDGIRFFADALVSLKNIEKMDLDANMIDNAGISYLAVALARAPSSLEILDVRRNLIGDDGMKHLAKALKNMKGLKEFNISSNKLSAQAGNYLGEVLNSIAQLRVLHMSQNDLGPFGTEYLAKALADNKSIETLYLSGNKIGNEGAIALGKAFYANKMLKNAHLQSNVIGPEGLHGLAEGIRKNDVLVYVDIRFNKLGQSVETICKEIEEEKQMKIKIVFY